MTHPLISAVIITYNQAWCIREAITSVLAQTYPHMEIVVVDDASSDGTGRIAASFGPRVKLIRNARRTRRAAVNRNTGARAAGGEYIAFLDGDDLWEPEKIAVQLAAARQHAAAGLIAVDGIQFLHQDGRILKNSLFADGIPWPSQDEIQVLNLFETLLRGCVIDTPSQILVPRRVFKAVEGFTPDLPPRPGFGCGEDYDFMIKVASNFDFVLIRRRLTRYRFHPSVQSSLAQQQPLYFTLGDVHILRRRLPGLGEGQRAILHKVLRDRFVYACRRAVEESRSGRRRWASGYLLQMAKAHWTPANAQLVALSLARVWRPDVLGRLVGALRSRARKKREA